MCHTIGIGATMDGCSVNRHLLKLHDFSAELVYKTKNPFSGTHNMLLATTVKSMHAVIFR